jgi:hypothetical protein
MYINDSDLDTLVSWLNTEHDIAFIIGDGPNKWRAVKNLDVRHDGRYCLWHCQSGPLPLLHQNETVTAVRDPGAGWTEEITGANSAQPYFGPGHPGIYWLNVQCKGEVNSNSIGLSSFEWIGNWYKPIGNEAPRVTKAWWDRLKRWVKKHAVQIPREGDWGGPNPEIWAFTSALDEIKNGRSREPNP